jgi:glycosyl transferase family 25
MLRFVINLDSSTKRLESISARLNELGISFERMPAINGRQLSSETISELTYPHDHFESRVRFTRELTMGEVGCFLSHRKCWEKLIASDQQWALIIEDDVLISNSAPYFMQNSDWIPEGVELCQLSCLHEREPGRIREQTLPLENGSMLVSPIAPDPLGTQCYVISRKAAQTALNLSQKFMAPVDNFLFSHWFEMSQTYTIWRAAPTVVVPDDDIASDIGARLKRNVKKAPFLIRKGLTRFLLDRKVKRIQKTGKPFVFQFR